MNNNNIYFTQFDTPLGKMLACAADKGICLLEFADRDILDDELKQLTKLFDAKIIKESNNLLDVLKKQLNEYFEGKRQEFTVPLFVKGTEFQESVWRALQTIPYGSTFSYKQQAEAINRPKAVRAVANANGINKIPIIIPCHRVIGSDGSLTGYGGGLWRKKWLLDLESKNKINK
jgi:AraC family transcriptional regulator of adaptative response/methylated-DNA-[protein]-cysteine methyltransferase